MLLLFFMQRSIMFPGTQRVVKPYCADIPYPLEEVWLKHSFGKTESYLIRAHPHENEILRPTVIYAHGNGEVIADWPEALLPYLEMGINVFLVEYPGYGRSDGKPSQKTIQEVYIHAYDLLL